MNSTHFIESISGVFPHLANVLYCSLLKDEVYVNEINRTIPTWIYEGRTDLSDPRSVWDWVKYNIKKHSRKNSMNKNKQRRREKQLLNKQFQNAHLVFQNDPSEENLVTLNVLKERMDKMYEEEVEGIIVRSRARWHEHGEKNSRYFLNLEKRNHVKKHVRKLRLSGVTAPSLVQTWSATPSTRLSASQSRMVTLSM